MESESVDPIHRINECTWDARHSQGQWDMVNNSSRERGDRFAGSQRLSLSHHRDTARRTLAYLLDFRTERQRRIGFIYVRDL